MHRAQTILCVQTLRACSLETSHLISQLCPFSPCEAAGGTGPAPIRAPLATPLFDLLRVAFDLATDLRRRSEGAVWTSSEIYQSGGPLRNLLTWVPWCHLINNIIFHWVHYSFFFFRVCPGTGHNCGTWTKPCRMVDQPLTQKYSNMHDVSPLGTLRPL